MIKGGLRGFQGLQGFSEKRYAAEFHAGAAGELGVSRGRWVCFPILLPETQDRLAKARLTLGLSLYFPILEEIEPSR